MALGVGRKTLALWPVVLVLGWLKEFRVQPRLLGRQFSAMAVPVGTATILLAYHEKDGLPQLLIAHQGIDVSLYGKYPTILVAL
jgi:hypothetical protein